MEWYFQFNALCCSMWGHAYRLWPEGPVGLTRMVFQGVSPTAHNCSLL